MSTLEVSNLNDGTTTVATTFITGGSAKFFARTTGTYTGLVGDSLNASSITDDSTGSATISFTNSFSSSNYSPFGTVLALSLIHI